MKSLFFGLMFAYSYEKNTFSLVDYYRSWSPVSEVCCCLQTIVNIFVECTVSTVGDTFSVGRGIATTWVRGAEKCRGILLCLDSGNPDLVTAS